jgi:hypothetical protein
MNTTIWIDVKAAKAAGWSDTKIRREIHKAQVDAKRSGR